MPPTKGVDKPPSKAAVPPQRIRLEAATTQSSLDTFSTPAVVPTKRRPFVDVSADVGRTPVGAGGSRQLGGWATPSRRWSAIFAAPYSPYPQVAYHYKDG